MTDNPVAVALEYVAMRNEYIERYRGKGGALLGNAAKPTQLQFINMCNQFATRFSDEFPTRTGIEWWEVFSRLNLREMSDRLSLATLHVNTLTQNEWEGCSELAKTYLALLRMREDKK